jgi:hypothetical protein
MTDRQAKAYTLAQFDKWRRWHDAARHLLVKVILADFDRAIESSEWLKAARRRR